MHYNYAHTLTAGDEREYHLKQAARYDNTMVRCRLALGVMYAERRDHREAMKVGKLVVTAMFVQSTFH